MGERTKKRLVVKVGTNTLTGGEDRLARPAMQGVARQIARLVRDGHQVALVSSGAIVAGRQALSVARDGKGTRNHTIMADDPANRQFFDAVAAFSATDGYAHCRGPRRLRNGRSGA